MAKGATIRIVYNRFPDIVRRMPGAAIEAIEETLQEMDKMVKSGMAASGGGRVYVRGGRSHTASAPGQMPAIDTAQLVGSLKHEIARGKYTGYYYTESPVGAHMEYGTSRGIAPRPFMTPAAEKARGSFMKRMRKLEDRLR